MQGAMGIIVLFVGVVITVLVATIILGSLGLDCDDIEGNTQYNWTQECVDAHKNAISGFSLLQIILIIIAAAGILMGISMFAAVRG